MKKGLFACLGILAISIAGCSSSGENTTDSMTASSAAVAEGPVTFTHPTIDGLEIEFDTVPTKLVMDCYTYSSLDDYGIKPIALFGYDCDSPWAMGDADTAGIERIGQDGEISVEKLAQLKPDAIIGHGDADGWSWFDDDVNKQISAVTTFVPLPNADTMEENFDAVEDLAVFLGADVDSPEIQQSHEDYKKAQEEFKKAVEGKDLNVMLASPTKEMLYTAVGFKQATMLESLGVNIIGGEPPAQGNPWGKVAWEEANTYPADVILVESYDEAAPFSAELWDSLPAVQQKQLYGWSSKGGMTYHDYAQWLQGFTQAVGGFNKIA